MENAIIAAILIVAVAFAVVRTRKHFKGGGCCGGKGDTIRCRKELSAPKIGEKILIVEGMTCANCQARVENVLNQLDGVACTVDLKKKTATVAYSKPVDDALLRERIENLGYKLCEIHEK